MRMKLKKSKIKFKKKIFILILLLLYIFSFSFTVKYYFNKNYKININNYLYDNYLYSKKKNNKIITKLISLILKIDFSNSLTFINNNYSIKSLEETEDKKDTIPISNYVKDKEPDLKIDEPIVYIYNTHQSEEYEKSNNQEYNVKPTVMSASYIIREKLNKNNIPSIVEQNDITEFLRTNNWRYSASYKVSRMLMENAKNEYSSLKYYVDIHRDSVNRNISTIKINDKNYAKILFIVGLENEKYQENLKLTEKLNSMFEEKYPKISRGIYKKKGPGVNGVYNQDFSPKTILIEVGGEENTIDEVNNTCEAISEILTEYIRSDLIEK